MSRSFYETGMVTSIDEGRKGYKAGAQGDEAHGVYMQTGTGKIYP